MNKIIKYLLLSLIVIIVVLGIGTIIYKNYNSIEKQSKRILQDDITSWYYSSKSIMYSGPNKEKGKDDRDKSVNLFRTDVNLDNNWQFVYEDYDLYFLGYSSAIVDTVFLFENMNDENKYIFNQRYYFDLNEPIPIPLKQDRSLIDKNKEIRNFNESTLWNGDFDAWCAKK